MAEDPKPGKKTVVQKGKFTLNKGGAKATNSLIEELKAKKAANPGAGASGGAGSEAENAQLKAAVEVPIEDVVLPLFAQVPTSGIPPLLQRFWTELAPKLSLPETSLSILEAFSNIDVTAGRVGQSLERNTYYADQFRRVIDSIGKREDTPSLEAAVVLLGMTNSRNLILALQMHRTLKGGHPEWKVVPPKKEAALQIQPNELLKFALRTEEPLVRAKSAYADTAFAAGMLFDWLACLAKAMEREDVVKYVDLAYVHALKSAKIGVKLSESIPELAGGKWIFAACLIHDVGKIVLGLLDANYLKFNELCIKNGLPREVRYFAERERFGVDHAQMSSLTALLFRVFEPIAPALRHHHRPFLLKAQPGGLFAFAQLIALASNMATASRKPEKPEDPVIVQWRGKEVELAVPFEALQAAIAEAQ